MRFRGCLLLRGSGCLLQRFGGGDGLSGRDVVGSLGHRDHAEVGAACLARPDGLGDGVDGVGDLGDQDDVRPARDARAQGQPARLVAHDLGQDHPVVAVGGGVEPVDGVGGDLQGGGEPEGVVGVGDVAVDGLGQVHHRDARLRQAQRVLRGAAATQHHQAVEISLLHDVLDGGNGVDDLAAHAHAVHLVAAGPEDGAADGEDPRQRFRAELETSVLGQAAHPVAETDQFHAVSADHRLAQSADGRVQAGGVAARGQDTDAFRAAHENLLVHAEPTPKRWCTAGY